MEAWCRQTRPNPLHSWLATGQTSEKTISTKDIWDVHPSLRHNQCYICKSIGRACSGLHILFSDVTFACLNNYSQYTTCRWSLVPSLNRKPAHKHQNMFMHVSPVFLIWRLQCQCNQVCFHQFLSYWPKSNTVAKATNPFILTKLKHCCQCIGCLGAGN